MFFDGCYLRYDDYNFFNESLSEEDRTVCGRNDFGGNKSVYEANTMELVRKLSVEAAKNDGFYVGFVNRSDVIVYGLAQCWEFVNGSACERCLEEGVVNIGSCTPKEEGRVLNAGCYMRYSTQKFYDNTTFPLTRNEGKINNSVEKFYFFVWEYPAFIERVSRSCYICMCTCKFTLVQFSDIS